MPVKNKRVESFAKYKNKRQENKRGCLAQVELIGKPFPENSSQWIIEMTKSTKEQKNSQAYEKRHVAKFHNSVGNPVKTNEVEDELGDPAPQKDFF